MSPTQIPEDHTPQTITRQVDIPDAGLQTTPAIKLPPEIAEERELRRYIKPDGVFVKNVHCMFIVTVGDDKKGQRITKPQYSPEEAEAVVIEICKKAGRSIATDVVLGRSKAVPGWNFGIRVPGMESSERKAPMKAVGEDRQKISEALIAKQQETIESMSEQLNDLLAKLAGSESQPAASPEKGKGPGGARKGK